jgi:hypothetical protein
MAGIRIHSNGIRMKAKQSQGIGFDREKVKTEQSQILKTYQISRNQSDVENE